jgi:hypothetical protein
MTEHGCKKEKKNESFGVHMRWKTIYNFSYKVKKDKRYHSHEQDFLGISFI